MGLISAVTGAAGGVLADTWRDYFYQEAIPEDTLMVKGMKRVDRRGSNNKGSDNIITDGSIIAVADGQCMIVVEDGYITEVCAQPGQFVYSNKSEPSLFSGNLGDSIKKTWEQFTRRLSFGGGTGRDTRIYYFNTKEIYGNKYGTVNPIPYRVVDEKIGLDVEISLRCHGEFAYRIVDPILFYKNLAGNTKDAYLRTQIDSQMRSDLLTALQPALGRLADIGSRYYTIVNHTNEIANELNSILSSTWGDRYGIQISSFGISSIEAPKEDADMIKELQRTAVFRNAGMAAANLNTAQAEAMKAAASNTSTGPMMAFAGMNMAAQAGGMNANQLYQMDAQQQMQQQQMQQQFNQQNGMHQGQNSMYQGQPMNSGPGGVQGGNGMYGGNQQMDRQAPNMHPQSTVNAVGTWTCSQGHGNNTGKFCSECGEPRPVAGVKCPSCGFTPSDLSNPPKFCPECGHPMR